MPRPRTPQRPALQPTVRGYARLERRLSLLAWLHERLGYENTADLLGELKPVNEGFREDGRSHISIHLESRSNRMDGLTVTDLHRYDDNIRSHLAAMNEGRPEPITLRYFQHLAALYTEIYLDWRSRRRAGLLRSLNDLVKRHNSNSLPDERYRDFADADLDKLAFWMATGGGKTLLLHLHYRQFIHYNQPPDNILLITPNEGLTDQHLEELRASGIPAARFDLNESSGFSGGRDTVKVTEITKLVLEKQGEGESVPVEAFEGNNLIFVDEGHKGSGGQAWRAVRDALGETGFTFEYSATFGQALAAANDDALLTEYGKAIAFDYSYRHFYNDGYGKDFHILNLQQDDDPEQTDTLLIANLLSFYEQQLVFARQEGELRPYNLSRPLWTFVGGSVNAVYREGRRDRSDILTVVRFLHRVLSEPAWAANVIGRLLAGESGLNNAADGRDIFADQFDYLRRHQPEADAVYRGALEQVMHAPAAGGGLQLCDLRGNEGELGLKVDGSDDYFGVIYIGDTAAFKRLVDTDGAGIAITEDALVGSLFDRINEPDSTVEVLAGARKFIEGWNSWRVSNMGLLNIGRSEGSQIIQLFGRGVRLRGRDMMLKRSTALNEGPHPNYIRLLETLNIFALRANYMAQFRDYLESEGISAVDSVELPLFIRPNQDFLNKGLVIPRLDDGKNFSEQETVLLQQDDNVGPVSVSLSATVQRLESGREGIAAASSGVQQRIPTESLDLVDWNKAYLELIEYKEAKGFSNLLVQPELLRPILEAGEKAYLLEAEETVVKPDSRDHLERLQEAVINILRKYADTLYRRRRAKWESNYLTYRQLDHTDDNFRFNMMEHGNVGRYAVRVQRNRTDLVQAIERLIEDCNALYREEQGDLPRIYFDRHLYLPLLVEAADMTSSPPGLQKSERKFVADLRDYCASEPEALPDGAELFLLRNLTRGKGVGFFESSGFYPDFILWVKTGRAQRIVFIEPHGMRNEKAYSKDDKAQLHERLPELAREISIRSGNPKVQLDSYIISTTPYDELKEFYDNGQWTREDFAAKHILFQEPELPLSYIARILRGQC